VQRNKRWVLIIVLVIAWIATVAAVKIILAPAVGAATLLQFDSSDTGFWRAMTFISLSSMLISLVSIVFATLIYLIFRAK
jgi:hypothetical protein